MGKGDNNSISNLNRTLFPSHYLFNRFGLNTTCARRHSKIWGHESEQNKKRYLPSWSLRSNGRKAGNKHDK